MDPPELLGRPCRPRRANLAPWAGGELSLVLLGLTVAPSLPRDSATRSPPGVESENGKQSPEDDLVTFLAISKFHFFRFCACTLPRRAPPFALSSSVRDDPGQYVYLRCGLCAPSKLLKPTCRGYHRDSISRDLAAISILGDRGRLNLALGAQNGTLEAR